MTIGANGELFGEPLIYTLDVVPSPIDLFSDVTVAPGEVWETVPGQTVTIHSPATFTNNGLVRNRGLFRVLGGATLDNAGDFGGFGNITVAGEAFNQALGSVGCRDLTILGGGSFSNGGDLACDQIHNEATLQTGADSSTRAAFLTNSATGSTGGPGWTKIDGCRNEGSWSNSGLVVNMGTCDTTGGTILNTGAWYDTCRGEVVGAGGPIPGALDVPCEARNGFSGQYYGLSDPFQGRFGSGIRFGPDTSGLLSTVGRQDSTRVELDLDGLVSPANPDDDVTSITVNEGEGFSFGPLVASILPDDPTQGTSTTLTILGQGFGTDTEWSGPGYDARLDDLLDGRLYVEVRTEGNPDGAARSQLIRSPYRCGVERTWYGDLDHDNRGNVTLTTTACMAPIDFVGDPSDCNDADRTVFGGALEINDGIDNQCPGDPGYGTIDEYSRPVLADATGQFHFPPQPGASGSSEVVFDDSPGFDSPGCQAITIVGTSFEDPATPAPNVCRFSLARPLSPNPGSFGAGSDGVERGGCTDVVTDPVGRDESFVVPTGARTGPSTRRY
jgi:hypothetical protein